MGLEIWGRGGEEVLLELEVELETFWRGGQKRNGATWKVPKLQGEMFSKKGKQTTTTTIFLIVFNCLHLPPLLWDYIQVIYSRTSFRLFTLIISGNPHSSR